MDMLLLVAFAPVIEMVLSLGKHDDLIDDPVKDTKT